MLRMFGITALALTVVVAPAAAQSKPATTTQSTAPTSSPTQSAFDKLSPGNQKITRALYRGQPKNGTTNPFSLDDIAALKQHKGWGEIFKEMQANGQIPPDVKNLGQLVSRSRHQSGTSSGTTITNGKGRSEVVGQRGKPAFSDRSGRDRLDDDGSRADAGRGSDMSGPGRGYGYGQGGDAGSGGGMGRSGLGGQGGGRGK